MYNIVFNIADSISETGVHAQLYQDIFTLKAIFGEDVNVKDLCAIGMIYDSYDFIDHKTNILKNLEKDTETSAFSQVNVNDGKYCRKTAQVYRIPSTDIIIYSAYYGFVLYKKNIDVFFNFISSIEILSAKIDEPSLDEVMWSENTISIKKDILFFSRSKDWFDQRSLPYSRSYLFFGPPGNGKTSTIRAISNYLNKNVETFSFSARYDDPDAAFKNWMVHGDANYDAPLLGKPLSHYKKARALTAAKLTNAANDESPKVRILLLEDLDRYFSKDESFKTTVSISAILNCLDGVEQRNDSILIATANDPKKLDPEVFLRPGRFDMRVHFESPNSKMIENYIRSMSSKDLITNKSIDYIVKMAQGHSMAFIKGIYLNAASKAFSSAVADSSECRITDDNMVESLNEMLQNLGRDIKSGKNGVGYFSM